jgi:4-hydroxy-3-polyprenylbenzoate decarboxylase
MAAVGAARRQLGREVPAGLPLPAGFGDPRVVMPGVLAVRGPRFVPGPQGAAADVETLCRAWSASDSGALAGFPLVALVDDSEMVARSLDNFLWVTFTRSNPATDVSGVGAEVVHKHWGCRGPLLIDARIKPHHAPPLEEDPGVLARIEHLFLRGGPLSNLKS